MKAKVLCGLDQLELVDAKLRDRRVGLMTCPTGIDRQYRSGIDIIASKYRLTGLFACEHGIRGDKQAGEAVDTYIDPDTGVPVYSTYGGTGRLTPEMLDVFDVLVIDLQDVGARFYTFLYSLSFALEECAKAGKSVVVLDRVNPIGGLRVEGTLLDERLASFVGMYALPTRYGLTIGEYALWVKAHLHLDMELTVAPLAGWQRWMYLDDLGIPWVAPSPNCATLQAALVYTGTCVFEGTNISEGRGTTLPFELIGAPFINAGALERRMNDHALPGVHFRRCAFTPQFSKHSGQLCHGVQLHITDRHRADAFLAGLLLLEEIRAQCPADFAWSTPEPSHLNHLLGDSAFAEGRMGARALEEAHRPALRRFAEEAKAFWLYHDTEGSAC